ncbi:hypothetical protein Ancab_016826 [Ancistrocladus abbreviatus]
MNRGLLQSSPVQQMMAAGNPIWWSLNNIRPPSHQHQQPSPFFPPPLPPNSVLPHFSVPTTTSSSSSSSPSLPFMEQEQLPESWSQLLLGGLVGEEEKASEAAAAQEGGFNDFLANNSSKKMENNDKNSWEDRQALVMQHHHSHQNVLVDHVKQENSSPTSYVYHQQDHQFQAKPNWCSHHPQLIPTSSPHESCVNTFNSNKMLDFSTTTTTTTTATTKSDARHLLPIRSDPSSESNSTATNGGGALKKAKVQHSSTQSPFKVRKEKLGDRITALHQLVSPFGKTDTASVLLEAIGYIRFLQSQIEALSLPYLSSGSANKMQSHSVQGERNCMFPEDPGQLLNDNCLKRKGGPDQEYCQEEPKDLRSRGLCLVPVSCTLHVGNDNGADYWAPALGGGIGGGIGGDFR